MKQILLPMICLILSLSPIVTSSSPVMAEDAPPIEWGIQFGTAYPDIPHGISVDSTGVYIAGGTWGAFSGYTNEGIDDVFVCKYGTDGNEVWTRQFGTTSRDYATGISIDSTGVYVAGYTDGTFPGQTSEGLADAFVRKYDASGNEVWTRQFGTTGTDVANGISIDSTGVYVAGYTDGALPGQSNEEGHVNAFIRKYDNNGNEVWTRQFGTADGEWALGISVDSTGVYVAGYFFTISPGNTFEGECDAFVHKYDINGNEVWTRRFGTTGTDVANGISIDSTGVYVSGYTDGAFPGQTNDGFADVFIRKYDDNGNEVWTCQFGTSNTDETSGISVHSTGVYVAGYTDGAFPGQINEGSMDTFICKLKFSIEEAIDNFIVFVKVSNLEKGITNSLISKLENSLKSLNKGQKNVAINKLNLFINQVENQRGKKISDNQADELIAQAQLIIDNM